MKSVHILRPYTEGCVHFVKISSSHVLNTPQKRRLTTKLRIVIGSMETKVVVKF